VNSGWRVGVRRRRLALARLARSVEATRKKEPLLRNQQGKAPAATGICGKVKNPRYKSDT
jgi:hypothetical protein